MQPTKAINSLKAFMFSSFLLLNITGYINTFCTIHKVLS
ncbi:hypothetical protein PUND_b0365 [Pseudoalteromonas undina]|nr:hypothetical protein PUND_b0365 [Pseudoalteromonas undina]